MNDQLVQVVRRRERLVAQAAAQRQALASDIEPWRTPLALADQGLNALRYIRRHPTWIVGSVVLLAVLQPRHAFKWAGRGLVAWQVMGGLREREGRLPSDT